MYTTGFYENYNAEFRSGKLKKFKVFTALLHSAVKKLSQKSVVTVYRGVSKAFTYPKSPFHFKQFTSTSFSEQVAKGFSETKKLQKFVLGPNSLAAKIASLSELPFEQEILVSPFQAFQFDKEDEKYVTFNSHGDYNFKC